MGGRVVRIITRLNRGGPLRQLQALVPALARRGWEGPVLAGRCASHEPDGAGDLEAAGGHVVRIAALHRGLDPAADVRALRALLARIRHERPDVVHTHTGKAGALGRIAAAIAGVPAVHTFHGHHLQAPWPRDRLAALAERALARFTTAAVCLTPRQRRDLCEIHEVLAPAQAVVIGPGLDVAGCRARARGPQAERIARRWRQDGVPLFVWAGRFVPVKDPGCLVRAAGLAERRFRLLLLGEGPLRGRVEALIDELGLREKVACCGPVRDTVPFLAAADAVVLSSVSEGAPMLVLEAKVLGRPAVATSVGGVPDLVRHGVDGWWVPPRSPRALARALDTLAGDETLRRRLGAAAAADAARFSAERLAAETAALYERVRAG